VPQTPVTMEDDVLLPLLTELMNVCRVNHFPQGNDLRATLFKALVGIAHGVGKQRFKRHYLELITELLFATLEVEHGRHSSNFRTDDARDGNQLVIHAAEQCCEELSELVGGMIFRGGSMMDSKRCTIRCYKNGGGTVCSRVLSGI